LIENFVPHEEYTNLFNAEDEEEEEDDFATEENNDEEIFEVSEVCDVRYDDANKETGPRLYFKVSWKGYNSDKDNWEPINGLSNC